MTEELRAGRVRCPSCGLSWDRLEKALLATDRLFDDALRAARGEDWPRALALSGASWYLAGDPEGGLLFARVLARLEHPLEALRVARRLKRTEPALMERLAPLIEHCTDRIKEP